MTTRKRGRRNFYKTSTPKLQAWAFILCLFFNKFILQWGFVNAFIQSNSMVEATYRWLKSSFLYGKKILNAVELEKYLQFYFHDHDEIKPHSAHKIYTPNEVYNGANPTISLTEMYQIASKNRRITNLASRCKIC
jgi:hypothetical protein